MGRTTALGWALGLGVAALTTGAAAAVVHDTAVVNGLAVDRFSWTDSQGLARTASIKQEGNGNPGHGGYAVQLTYQYLKGAAAKTVTVNQEAAAEGFGYFVSHERYRDFTDNDNDTIAHKIFGVDDSPLGRGFAVAETVLAPADHSQAGLRITTTYHHYGTVDPIPKLANGDDQSASPTDPAKYVNYALPVTITWSFQDGRDYPLIRTSVDLSQVGPDRVNFDVRGPYGVLDFKPAAAAVDTAMWGDRFHFINTETPIKRTSGWTWSEPNKGGRYLALISGHYEMGLFEPRPFAQSALTDPYAGARGLTSATYRNGKGCQYENQLLPCDWEWPYQSVQYSLPADPTSTTNYPKMAWGSSAFYGTGPSLSQVYDTNTTSEPFVGHPAAITYDICLVLGRTTSKGLTRTAARGPSRYNCAAAAD